jgi:hypothetical protein
MHIAGVCRDIDRPDGLRGEVMEEIESQERLLERLSRPRRGLTLGHVLVTAMLVITFGIMLSVPSGALAWFIVAFLLYSLNFALLFIPTTRKGAPDGSCQRSIGREVLGPLRFLLRERRKLAIEVGITVLFGGIVTLALSFFVLFGIGLFLAGYLTFAVGQLEERLSWLVIGQVLIILLFFAVMVLVRPDVQGPTRIARTLQARYDRADELSRWHKAAMAMAIGLAMVGVSMLVIDALLLTGGVLGEVLTASGRLGTDLLLVLLVLVVEVVVLRHFQAVSSRGLARKLVSKRLETLRGEVLDPLTTLLGQGKGEDGFDRQEFERIRAHFFNSVVYDVHELNFFGYSPVYVVAPNFKYLIDERVVPFIGGP